MKKVIFTIATIALCLNAKAQCPVTITGADTVCSGITTTLTASGATSYTWMPSGVNNFEVMRIVGSGSATGNIAVANKSQILLNGTDLNHGLGAFGAGGSGTTFANRSNINGPVLYGFDGGVLGTTDGGQKVALQWNNNGQVFIGTQKPNTYVTNNSTTPFLSVSGAIIAQEIWVQDVPTAGWGAWPDFVFKKDYKLMP